MYMQDDTTTLGLLLGADSFTTFLTNTDSMARVAEHDRKLVANLTSQREELEQAKAELAQRLEQLESDKAQNEEKQQTLWGSFRRRICKFTLWIRWREYYADLKEQGLCWLPCGRKSTTFTPRSSGLRTLMWAVRWRGGARILPHLFRVRLPLWRQRLHTGMDIAGTNGSIYGATVVAANTGTVKYVNWSYTRRGYGIYLILDHGGGISTLYAHLSNIQSVWGCGGQGDPIGNVGSTGGPRTSPPL